MLDGTDIILIHQLLGRYGHLLDAADWDRFAELWTPDARIDYQGSTSRTEAQGTQAIVEYFRTANNPRAHHVVNIVVDETADPDGPVEVHSKFFAPFTRPTHDAKRLYGGDYRDVVERSPDGWRFAFRRCTPSWQLTVVVDDDVADHRRTY